MKLWFCEYYREGSGIPVDCSIGIPNLEQARHRGKVVAQFNGYCGFWILAKPAEVGVEPVKVEYHSVSYDPRGVPTWRYPLSYKGARE